MMELLIQFPEDFEERYKKYKASLGIEKVDEVSSERAVGTLPLSKAVLHDALPTIIFYNPENGVGNVGEKKFKLKNNERPLFAQMYSKINKEVSRGDVLIAIGFYQDFQAPDPARKTSETTAISEIAKSLRNKTDLNTEQIINNGGNLTLIGQKKKSPKNS